MAAERSNTDLVDLIEQTVSSIDDLLGQIEESQWDLPTDLPGWSVKDNLSHLCHFEATAIGRPTREVDVADEARLENEFQRANERGVEARRGSSGREVADEFRAVTAARLKILRDLDPDGWDQPLTLPVGEFKQGDMLSLRVMDLYFHEQDMRRAVGKPGHLAGGVARYAFERLRRGMGMVISKQLGEPDGTRVRFTIGEPGEPFDVIVRNARGEIEPSSGDPLTSFSGDLETFLCVAGGRWTPNHAIAEGRWTVEGDGSLATRINDKISVIP